jgi:hypothetical protein
LIAGAWVVSNQAAKAAIEKSSANQEAEAEDEKSYLEDDEGEADGEDDHESEEPTSVWNE